MSNMSKVNNIDIRTRSLTLLWCGVFIVNIEHILSYLFLVFLLLTLNRQRLAGTQVVRFHFWTIDISSVYKCSPPVHNHLILLWPPFPLYSGVIIHNWPENWQEIECMLSKPTFMNSYLSFYVSIIELQINCKTNFKKPL